MLLNIFLEIAIEIFEEMWSSKKLKEGGFDEKKNCYNILRMV